MQKLSTAEFTDALKKGKGRAFIHVRDHGDTGIESELLHACLHSLAYDTQCEGDRGSWMMDLIEYTKSPDNYYQGIVSNFIATTEFWDVSQLSTMLTLLAKRDYPGAKDLLYKKFGLQEFRESVTIGADLIELDGIKGMLHVAEIIGKRIQSDSDYWEDNYLTNRVCEPLGKKTADALQEAAKNNLSIKAYVDNVIATSGCLFFSDEENKSSSAPKKIVSLEEFLSEIDKSPKRTARGYCFGFGRNAASQDIQKLFTMLAAEKDREKLLRYLWVFRKAELPEVPKFMLAFAESADEELRNAALTALANVKNKAVRDFAMNLLNDAKLEAIELFEKNYVEGDFQRIMEKLHTNDGIDKVHGYGLDILRICDHHNNHEASDCLTWLYENTPCALCRNGAVDKLMKLDILPPKLAEECLCDCYEDTRKEVAAFIAN